LGAVVREGVDSARYWDRLFFWIDPKDIYSGRIKAAIFAIIVTTISCFYGLTTRNGAKGVGISTTKAVVSSSVAILIADYVLADLLITILYKN
jgi:phospholipid/cholesterol/gamma-HCH transport system permease protein